MSKKVILTKEQAEAIEWALNESDIYMNNPDGLLSYSAFAGRQQDEEFKFKYELKPINDMKISQLAKALYVGYEVEPEYMLGEYVVYLPDGKVYKIYHIPWTGKVHLRNGVNLIIDDVPVDKIRHATSEEIAEEIAEEKERRFWRRNGRGLKEIKKGDVLKNEKGYVFVINLLPLFSDEIEDLKAGRLKVVCFIEDRLDVKENE